MSPGIKSCCSAEELFLMHTTLQGRNGGALCKCSIIKLHGFEQHQVLPLRGGAMA